MAKKTKKPTGLTITRNNNVFTLTWKLGEKYEKGQAVQYRTNLQGWTALSVGATATSRAVGLNTGAFYPTTARSLQWIEMRVRGAAKKKTVSDWSVIRFTLQVPRIPTLTATMDDQLSNVCVFAWTTVTAASDAYWFINTEYQSMLVKESNITDGSQLLWNDTQQGWQSGTSTAGNSVTVTEDTSAIADGSYTRWFRVRARGPLGASGWSYAKHVYGLSYQANIISAVATVQPAGGFQCRVEWEAPASASHPIDRTTVEYTITAPEEGLTCPDSATWTSASVSADTENADAAVFPIDRLLAANQCLFVRVNTQHDNVVTYGLPVLAEGGVGVLSDPTLTSVVLGDNYMVTINATNNSPVEDSFLVILYRPSSDPAREIVIGTIPHGSTTANVQAPDWSGEDAFAFGVYAAVGSAVGITHDSALMASSIVWGEGDVPKAPANVRVSATNISGTIRVEWDWTWTNATGAELSWSDHEDAWESTDQPDTYEISSIHNSRWHISGLETGIKWYVKVRLKKGTGDNETYGPYSETAIIDLTSAPSIPTLVLSESVITETGSVTASWVYTTTDGTAQTYAEICEAEITTEGIEYGDVIAHTETAQHVTISAEEIGWQSGNTYNLCVRVVSASGRVSDEWSAPVPIAIAEPLEVNITETSLVSENIETNPRTFSGNPISFETEMEEQFAELKVELEPTQSGSGTASPSNVRPIYGVGGAEVLVRGFNLWDEQWENGGINTSGNPYADSSIIRSKNFIPIAPNTAYCYMKSLQNDNVAIGMFVHYYDENYTFISRETTIYTNWGDANFVKTSPNNARYIKFFMSATYGNTYNNDICINVSDAELNGTYQPYQSEAISQEFDVSLTPTSTDTDPYLFKAVGDIYGDRLEEDIVGGTVNWNQLTPDVNSSNWTNRSAQTTGSSNIVDGVISFLATAINGGIINTNATRITVLANHVYLQMVTLKMESGTGNVRWRTMQGIGGDVECSLTNSWVTFSKIKKPTQDIANSEFTVMDRRESDYTTWQMKNPLFVDLTQMFGSTIADYIYSLEQANAGAGVAWFKSYGFFTKPYYEYDAGTLKSVNPTAHVTRGVNAFDGETESGTIWNGSNGSSTSYWRTKNYIPVVSGETYYFNVPSGDGQINFFDANKNWVSSVNGMGGSTRLATVPNNACFVKFYQPTSTDKNTVCINISNPTINGKYFPYEEHIYELGNVELRGIPKLDASNNLYYDGDTYESDGTVTRKYGIVDLGTLYWNAVSSQGIAFFYAELPNGSRATDFNGICPKYPMRTGDSWHVNQDKVARCYGSTAYNFSRIGVRDSAYTDATAFKSAMSGVYLVYELATPTTETADAFEEIQKVTPIYGTEEFVDNRAVPIPVGNNTQYFTRDIYGGYIDLVSGVLTVDKVLVDLGTLNWVYDASVPRLYSTGINSTVSMSQGNSNPIDAICSQYVVTSFNDLYARSKRNGTFAVGATGTLSIIDTRYSNAADFKTAMNGVQLVYELATPQTYQLTPQQIQTLLGQNNVWSDADMEVRIAESVRNVLSLQEMPLTLTVDKTNITAVIERANSYHIDRPDETSFDGSENETIAIKKGNVESFNIEDLIGALDDGASYRLIVTVKDELGQSAEDSADFEVHWSHQAVVPEGTVIVEEEDLIAKITPIAPTGALATDVCDIYRLSADRPELVVKGAQFGTTYVDPYMTIGQFGGYRLVFRTANGDYITEENEIAWLDLVDETLEIDYTVIDFDGGRIMLHYNVDVSSSWTKDFQETKYLGGSVQGDWNPAVSRTSSISAVSITITDEDQMEMIRRLAVSPTICHVRTKDGSSYAADVQVSEDHPHDKRGKVASYTFSITRVDTEELDGMTLAQWNEINIEEE